MPTSLSGVRRERDGKEFWLQKQHPEAKDEKGELSRCKVI
jgi:hypothetical protein